MAYEKSRSKFPVGAIRTRITLSSKNSTRTFAPDEVVSRTPFVFEEVTAVTLPTGRITAAAGTEIQIRKNIAKIDLFTVKTARIANHEAVADVLMFRLFLNTRPL